MHFDFTIFFFYLILKFGKITELPKLPRFSKIRELPKLPKFGKINELSNVLELTTYQITKIL